MDENKELFDLLDHQAKTLVGILLKRIEILEQEKALTPSLYKKIIKESIYESFRTIKTILNIGRIEFRTRPKE